MTDRTDWKAVTEFFNGVIEQAEEPIADDSNDLTVTIYSAAQGHDGSTLQVVIPRRHVEKFMKNLPLFEAKTWSGKKFCNQCNGPYSGWLEAYGGHWDTCPNRHSASLKTT